MGGLALKNAMRGDGPPSPLPIAFQMAQRVKGRRDAKTQGMEDVDKDGVFTNAEGQKRSTTASRMLAKSMYGRGLSK